MYIFPLRKKLSREKGKEKRKKAFVLFHPKITRPFIPYLSASSSFKSPLTYTVFSLSLCLFLRLIRNENRRKKGGERKQRKGKVWFPFLPRLPSGGRNVGRVFIRLTFPNVARFIRCSAVVASSRAHARVAAMGTDGSTRASNRRRH